MKFVPFALLCGAAAVSGASDPDATSTVSCQGNNANPGGTLPECTLNVQSKGNRVLKDFNWFAFTYGDEGAKVSNVQPPSGNAATFTFQVTVSNTTTGPTFIGSSTLNNQVNFSYYVWDIPDSTSQFSCDCKPGNGNCYLKVGQSTNCTTNATKSGKHIWTKSTQFTPADSKYYSFTDVSPDGFSTAFHFTATAKDDSNICFITDGISAEHWNTTITNKPDSTTTMDCSPLEIQVGKVIKCSLQPQTKGQPVYAHDTDFKFTGGNSKTGYPRISGVQKTFNDLAWSIGNCEDCTGLYQLSNGVSPPTPISVFDVPDGTTTLTCGQGLPKNNDSLPMMGVGGTVDCVITPSISDSGHIIYSQSTIYAVVAQDKDGNAMAGTYSPADQTVLPTTVSNKFHFSLTPTAEYDKDNYLSISAGKGDSVKVKIVKLETADSSSVLDCNKTHTMEAKATIKCTLQAKKSAASVFIAGSSIKLSDGDNDGKFSALTPAVGQNFTFTYTAGDRNRKIVISDGVGNSYIVTITGGTDMPVEYIILIIVGCLLGIGVLACCFRKRNRSGETERLLGTHEDP
mmetsp:Transcript_21677/g.43014  ORF Transcript_21677/g.43014 Transcript_21677/m.43014 type:complete len:570 (+) Transcript_21677:27-1736(+)